MTCSSPRFAPRWLPVAGVALALALPSWPAAAARADAAPEAEVPEPSAEPTFSVVTPIKVRGKLSKSARSNLVFSLKTAAAGATAEGGPYRLALRVNASKKKTYGLTLTVLAADGTTVASHQDGCKGCTLVEAAGLIPGLVQTASSKIVPPPPPAPVPGSLTVASVPLGATVIVDGTEHGLSPQTLELPPGEHTIVVTKPGFTEHRETITLEDGGELKVEPTLAAVAAAVPAKGRAKGKTKEPKPPKGPKSTKGRPWIISGGVVMGLGLAGVATGIAMLLIDEQAHGFKCSDADLDFRGVCRHRYDTLTGGIVGTAVGALGIGGGIALMVQGRRVNVKARASATQASVDLVLRF
ncbi:MAG: PEGA domain-containing protein [Nannocystaceae bacterium]